MERVRTRGLFQNLALKGTTVTTVDSVRNASFCRPFPVDRRPRRATEYDPVMTLTQSKVKGQRSNYIIKLYSWLLS